MSGGHIRGAGRYRAGPSPRPAPCTPAPPPRRHRCSRPTPLPPSPPPAHASSMFACEPGRTRSCREDEQPMRRPVPDSAYHARRGGGGASMFSCERGRTRKDSECIGA
eukprot:3940291-Rhodomonas_salina.1